MWDVYVIRNSRQNEIKKANEETIAKKHINGFHTPALECGKHSQRLIKPADTISRRRWKKEVWLQELVNGSTDIVQLRVNWHNGIAIVFDDGKRAGSSY